MERASYLIEELYTPMKTTARILAAATMSLLLTAWPATLSTPTDAAPIAEAATTSYSALQTIDSYTIYYGLPDPVALATLQNYDMVIIEPRLWTSAQVQSLTARGIQVLGYLSVLEQHSSSQVLMQAEDSDYLYVNGVRHYRSEWDSWSMNINSAKYRALLFADYEAQIVQKGLTGVFLDTVGNSDDGIWPDLIADAQRDGTVSFITDLRSKHPHRPILQNWGLGALKDRTAPYIDGILWEDFTPEVSEVDEWSQNRMCELDALRATQGLTVFTVKAGVEPAAQTAWYDYSRAHGYVGQVIASSYDEL